MEFKIKIDCPMDDNSADIKENDIDYYYSNLAENIDRTPASLIFNIEEAC